MASISLTNRFIEGLKKYNLTYDEIKKNNWRYCGGEKERHFRYFELFFGHRNLPERTDECVCGHHIKENCYITDGEYVLILGNCCIKKFGINLRRCDKCNEPHKNRTVNRCNKCRVGCCDKCGKNCKEQYKTCYNCHLK